MKPKSQFISYKTFCVNHGLRKIVEFYPDDMDIMRCKSGVMNSKGDVFKHNDLIYVKGLKLRIIGFAAYDYDYFGAICVGRNRKSGIAKWFRLDDAINITAMKSECDESVLDILARNNFVKYNKGHNMFVRGKTYVEIRGECFDAYNSTTELDRYESVCRGVDMWYLNLFLDKVNRIGLDGMFFNSIDRRLMRELSEM